MRKSAFAVVAARDLVEHRLAVRAVDVPPEHAALAGPEALPDIRRGAIVDGACDLVEPQASAALRRRRRRGCRSSRRPVIAWSGSGARDSRSPTDQLPRPPGQARAAPIEAPASCWAKPPATCPMSPSGASACGPWHRIAALAAAAPAARGTARAPPAEVPWTRPRPAR